MKKLALTLLTIIAACGKLIALPLGNPAEASLLCDGLIRKGNYCGGYNPCNLWWCNAISARFGYYGDFVFNRRFQLDEESEKYIEKTKLRTNAGYVAANVFDRLDLFSTFGTTRILLDSNASVFGGPNGSRFKIESSEHFSWSVGIRATLFEWGCTSYGIEAQYFYTRPDLSLATLGGDASDYPTHFFHVKYWEWQVGLGIAHRINNLVPYLGAKYSRAKFNADNSLFKMTNGASFPFRDLISKFNGGFVAGLSLIDCEKASLTVEYRFPDERALYVNGQVRF